MPGAAEVKERSWAISSDSAAERSGEGQGEGQQYGSVFQSREYILVLGGGQGNRQGSLTCVCFPPVLEKTRIKASCR